MCFYRDVTNFFSHSLIPSEAKRFVILSFIVIPGSQWFCPASTTTMNHATPFMISSACPDTKMFSALWALFFLPWFFLILNFCTYREQKRSFLTYICLHSVDVLWKSFLLHIAFLGQVFVIWVAFWLRGLSASWEVVVWPRGYLLLDAIYMHSYGVYLFLFFYLLGLLEYNCCFMFWITVYVSAILRCVGGNQHKG